MYVYNEPYQVYCIKSEGMCIEVLQPKQKKNFNIYATFPRYTLHCLFSMVNKSDMYRCMTRRK